MAKNCQHPNFNFTAKMLDVDIPGVPVPFNVIELTAQCDRCGEDFVFTDLEVDEATPGMMRVRSHTTADGRRARLPVAPASMVKSTRETLN